jgi:hypothetical protein
MIPAPGCHVTLFRLYDYSSQIAYRSIAVSSFQTCLLVTFFRGSVPTAVLIILHLLPLLLDERLPGKVQADPGVLPSSFYFEGFSFAVPSSFSEGAESSTMSSHSLLMAQ